MPDRVKNPYIGPRSFKQDQGNLFFGRDYEATELLALVVSNRLVMFYAQSGAGKSSLVNARLVPDLRKEGFLVLPIGRVSGASTGDLSGPVKNIFTYNLMLSLDEGQQEIREKAAGKANQEEPEPYAGLSLDQFMGRLATEDGMHYFYDSELDDEEEDDAEADSDVPHVLLIDQFEEILTTNVDRWREREDFFRQLGEAMRADPMMWVVFILREDYVAALDPFAHLLPGNMSTGFYMQRMARAAALEAITRPAALAGRPYAEDAAGELVDKLSLVRVHGQDEAIPGQFIEPVQLQVVCHQLWEKLEQRDHKREKEGKERSDRITKEDLALAPVERALSEFYETALAETVGATQVSEIALRDWFENELITEARTRGTVYQGAEKTGSLYNDVVDQLQSSYLVRGESRAGGRWIELIHDSFIEPILDANKRWQDRNPLVKAALAWQASDEDESLLYGGTALAEALKTPELKAFGRTVSEFLAASQEKEARLRSEMALSQKLQRLEAKEYGADERGWGLIFAAKQADDMASTEILKEALDELLQFRRRQAGELFKIFEGADGYRPDDTTTKFLARHGVAPGTLQPEKVPYYLLIVGDPEAIPWSFQYQLNLTYGVGRIHFEALDDYARYARSVVAASEQPGLPRRAHFFSVKNPDDQMTGLGHEHLATPLFEELARNNPTWRVSALFEDEATKENLSALMHGDQAQTPALFFAQGHAMPFPNGHEKQIQDTGALVCQDWPGPKKWAGKGELTPDLYFAADDVSDEARLLGMVLFLAFGPSVGMPRYDDFSKQAFREDRKELAPRPFITRLPQRLLSHPNGGALAVIGHVERLWGYSFLWPRAGAQIGVFSEALARLVDGYPVGAAMEGFGSRYGQLAAILSMELEEIEFGKKENLYELAGMWTATNDARNYVIFGDPAVKVHVVEEGKDVKAWPTIEPVYFRPVSAPNVPEVPPDQPGPQEVALPSEPVVETPTSRGAPDEKPTLPLDVDIAEDLLYFNGIDGNTGEYRLPPMSAEELVKVIIG